MSRLSRRSLLAAVPLAGAASLARPQDSGRPVAETRTRFAANVEMWWRKLEFLDRLRAAHDLGFAAVEFWPWKGKDIDAIAALTSELGLEVAQFTAWGFNPGLNDPANHKRFLRTIKAGCEVAAKLRCKKMTVVGGNDQRDMTQREMHDYIIEGLKQAAPIAEANDVMLILEPMNIRVDHKGHCLYGSEGALRICREVDSTHVKINWDLYHMQISEGDLCGRLRDGFDQVGYLQLADHPGRTEPGTGEIHYNRVLKQAWDLGYRDWVGVECRPKTTEAAAAEGLARADVW